LAGALFSHKLHACGLRPENKPVCCSNCKVVGRLSDDNCKPACHGKNNHFFCRGCALLLPPEDLEPLDYFSLLELEPNYRVDIKQIGTRFKALQRELHPDKFSTASQEEQMRSAGHSAMVNTAVSTLRSPLRRALYLLKMQGIDFEEDQGTIDDPEFLMEVMETRMAVDEADSEEELKPLREQNLEALARCENDVAQAFDRSDLDAVRDGVIHMTYLCKIQNVISSKTN